MEFWILLAAAGSGYLARRWQNLHKYKEASSAANDDDDSHSGSSWGTLSSTESYNHLASSNKRFKGSSYQNRHVFKLNDSVGNATVGCAPYLSDSTADAGVLGKAEASKYGVILNICSCANRSMHSLAGLNAVGSCHTKTKYYTVSPLGCPALHTCDDFYADSCYGFKFSHQTTKGHGILSTEAISGNRFSAYRTGARATYGSGSMLHDDLPLRLMCYVQDDDRANEGKAFSYDGKSILGYLNAFEDTFALEISTSNLAQEHEGRSNTNNKKVLLHRDNCRCRRGRNLESHSASICSESCFSAHVDDLHGKEEKESNLDFSSDCENPSNGLEEQSENESLNVVVVDSPLTEELLSAPRPQSIMVSNKMRNSAVIKEALGSAHWSCSPLQSSRRGQVKAPPETSAAPPETSATLNGDNCLPQGTDSSMKTLSFNFGVGVGMMFAILSNHHHAKQSIGPLAATLCALEALEAEVHGLMFEWHQTKHIRKDTLAEQINELFNLVMRIFDAVQRVRNFLPQDLACISATMDLKHLKERAMLESELKVELTKMQMDLCIEDFGRGSSSGSEDDLTFEITLGGELSIRGLPFDDEPITEIGSGADSWCEISQSGNFGVSAKELAMRLYEVLDARQAREISELKAEVKHLVDRLQAKDEELQVWKQRVWQLSQGGFGESFPSFQEKDMCVEAVERAETVCRTGAPCCFSVGKHRSAFDSSLSSCCNEHICSNCSKEACSLHLRVREPVLCATHDTDDEVLDQFLSSTETGSSSSSPKCIVSSLHAKDNATNGLPMSHQELESIGFLRDTIDETLDNSPYFTKFVDKQTVLHHKSEDKTEHKLKEDIEALTRESFSTLDWIEVVVPTGKAISNSGQKLPVCTQDVIEISENHEQAKDALGWSTSEDSSYSSDLDEKLGQMLIKRIVEKSKRGSLIVEVAQSAMASFDTD